jgi:hypothetical protein
MAWHRVGERLYYYRSVRVGNSVRRAYAGTDPAGAMAAAEDPIILAARERHREGTGLELF